MKHPWHSTLPDNDRRRKYIAIGITTVLAGLLTLWGIYSIREYGIALFVLTPLFIGATSTILYGLKGRITKEQAFHIGLLSLGIFTVGLLVFAIEGIICVVMAVPIVVPLTLLGSLLGYALVKRAPDNTTIAMLILIGAIPTMAFYEKEHKPAVTSVTTSIEIHADPHTVWRNIIEFPQLAEPTELLFTMGIAYPIDAKIQGTGIGATRYCNFTTGRFVEPITVWDEPRLLQFAVAEQPEPMKELSFWDIDAPHLHDYFVSTQGQFKLTPLPNGNTLVEGTTWYYHNIKPAFYWQLWSNYIIHKIHNRVLVHIKNNAENNKRSGVLPQ